MKFYEMEELVRLLKFELCDKALCAGRSYQLYFEMGRMDLAGEQLAIQHVLTDIIEAANMEEDYKKYCEYASKQATLGGFDYD